VNNVAKLVHMANQIGDFYQSQPAGKSVEGIADHVAKFWSRSMKEPMFAHLRGGGAGLHPVVEKALRGLMESATLATGAGTGAGVAGAASGAPRTIDPAMEKKGLNNALPDNANLGAGGAKG
jgi:formate dehydrogenase subunit delta